MDVVGAKLITQTRGGKLSELQRVRIEFDVHV
jgi:hypothetical protein